MMIRSEQREIERLVDEVAEEGASAERIGRLGTILLDRPDLQQYYARVMALHSLLTYELDLSLHKFTPLAELEVSCPPYTSGNDRLTLLDKLHRIAPWGRFQQRPRRVMLLAALSVASAILIVALFWGMIGKRPATAQRNETGADHATTSVSVGALVDGNRNLVVRDERSLSNFSRATNTPLLSSMLFPVCNAREFPVLTFCSGTVWMEHESGERDRGHIVAVPSGYTIELLVDADARGQNALSIVEFDEYGRIDGSTVNFNNMGDDDASDGGFANIGRWSQRNDTGHTKYFLFTGTHTLLNHLSQTTTPKSELWRLSNYRVLLDLSHTVYIGWDDSGYTVKTDTLAPPRTGKADYDFDDITAFVRIVPPESTGHRSGELRYVPRSDMGHLVVEPDRHAYQFSVAPGTGMVLRVTTDAAFLTGVDIVEKATREVVWHLQNEPRRGHQAPSVTKVYYVENGTDEVHRYYVRAMHKVAGHGKLVIGPWLPTAYRVGFADETRTIVAYEDRPSVVHCDWNDVLIQLRSIPEIP